VSTLKIKYCEHGTDGIEETLGERSTLQDLNYGDQTTQYYPGYESGCVGKCIL